MTHEFDYQNLIAEAKPYQREYRRACKWNARLLFAAMFLLFVVGLLSWAYYWETQHPRPRYTSEARRAVEPVMPYHKRSY